MLCWLSTDEERKGKASPTPKRLSIVLTDSGPPSPVPLSKNYAKAVSIPDLLVSVSSMLQTFIIPTIQGLSFWYSFVRV